MCSVSLGKPQRERRQQRLGNGGRVFDERLIGRARQRQHAGVADRDDVGGAGKVGEEADFADQFAGAELGDRQRSRRSGVRRARHAARCKASPTGSPCATSISPRTRSCRTMASRIFSRCSELSVRNSANSSKAELHASTELDPLIWRHPVETA